MPQLEIINATGANMATREMANYFAMVKLPISQQGVFFPAFLSPGIVDRFKKATKRGVGWEKTFESCFVEKASLAQEIKNVLSFQKDDLEVEEYLEKIEKMTKNILSHELNEVGIYNMILQSSLNDDENKKNFL